MRMPEYEWFSRHASAGGVQQGLILPEFPVPDYSRVDYAMLASDGNEELPVEIKTNDLIVMTQACDLENDKVKNVTLCRVYTLREYLIEASLSKNKAASLIDGLNSGRVTNMCLLNRPADNLYESAFEDYLVVKFDESVNFPIEIVRQRVSNETNDMMVLLPPYREALSQSYGIFYMRVGNPINIPRVQVGPYEDFLTAH